ncbi:protein translocase subunit SecD [Suttonella ornithocola]|uniref:Protein translocase subunit SecD n=1 Tax=Suttonella ornithocola TaxID=279832 RepID=A0A380MV24_9GAMM|nr:protein translocase subunit SecD [Suttonella ornithocola]SUO95561.1 preprotein translocase subunit SecD [Suttonella ornithocola]
MPRAFPTWKYFLTIAIVVIGFVFALPNWFGKSPAVQMQFESADAAQLAVSKITETLKENHIPYIKLDVDDKSLNVFFNKTDDQIQARDILAKDFPKSNAAVNLLSNTPQWMQAMGLSPMNLGLDLRGGVSFLLQVDSKELFERKSAELIDLSRNTLEKDSVSGLSRTEAIDNGGAILWFSDEQARSNAQNTLYSVLPLEVQRLDINDNGKYGMRLQYTEQGINALKRRAADQNRMRMAGRVNSLGVAEPSIQVVGDDRILVQLPGIQDVNKAKELLGSTATLEFYLVDETGNVAEAARLKRAPFGDKLAYFEDGTPILLKRRVIMSGEHIVDATAGFGQGQGSNGPQVDVVLDSAGGAQMAEITRENLHKAMATVYVEYTPVLKTDAAGNAVVEVEKHETVVNSAVIQGQFSSHFQITGVTPITRAQKLAATLRAGSLVAPVYIIEERTIGPSAGQKNIDQGINASLLGLALIALFMLIYYRKLGIIAVIVLSVNLVLLVALMSLLGATLTLPGIAGIVLTLGMAVDANVLIYERIREELDKGVLSAKDAARAGFDNALSTIVDANITTLIVAILLFSFGSGPIKGFAVTLSVGILTSMFSAIWLTRALVEFFMLRRAQPKISL